MRRKWSSPDARWPRPGRPARACIYKKNPDPAGRCRPLGSGFSTHMLSTVKFSRNASPVSRV
jgi:hypothetical protein